VSRQPDPHLAFGRVVHACIGMNVARLARCRDLLLRGTPRREPRIRFRGWRTWPVTL
jgi:cytochrome P450